MTTTFPTRKQPATGSRGMVVANHPLGAVAGVEMLAVGGNAIDAAIASLFALTVVEPMMVGIFGAGMSTIRLANGEFRFINNYTVAPAAAMPAMYRPVSDVWPKYEVVEGGENDVGVLAVGVPGTLKGWAETLAAYGTLSLADVMQPAIRFAENGFPASQYLVDIIQLVRRDIARFPATAATWLPGGEPLQVGDLVCQGDYAQTLRLIVKEGPDALYGGALGERAVDYIQSAGGIMTMGDLTSYRTMPADVVRGNYRGFDIIGPPPPSAGGVHVIEMLNVLEGFDVAKLGFGTVDGVHLLAETLALGFEDRRRYMGDPAFADVPVQMLIDKDYAARRRGEIDMGAVRPVETGYVAESNATTHMAAADAEGNVIAATHTIHSPFGSKATVPGTGMLLNNTMNIFDPHPGMANSIAPGKRVTSSMAPIVIEKDGKPFFCVGLVGGLRIFPSALQAIVNVIDHGMTAQQAVEAPRVWTLGEDLEMEEGFPDDVLRGLRERGHKIVEVPAVGGGTGMIQFQDGQLVGASCWRADGSPIGLGGGWAQRRIVYQ